MSEVSSSRRSDRDEPARGAEPDVVRADVRQWLRREWDPSLSLITWRHRLVDSGWAVPSWSRRCLGLGLPGWADDIVAQEIASFGVPGLPLNGGRVLASSTIMMHGSDSLRERFLRPVLCGEERWCQLFSEPEAGSDLAGLVTRAMPDGDQWIINGRKIWNTGARNADFGMLVARSNWDVPKHRGLTYFVLPMRQEGVEVWPIRQMNNHASFYEVVMTNALVPEENVIGDVGSGWSVALTTLAYERRFGPMSPPQYQSNGGSALEEARSEAAEHLETFKWYPQRAGRVDLVVDRAKAVGRGSDPLLRQEIAGLLSMERARKSTGESACNVGGLGRSPGAEGSLGKLAISNIARQAATVHSAIGGPSGMLTNGPSPSDAVSAEVLVSVPAQSIAGGTDEVQRNIIAEKVLGLPRDPGPDKELPFQPTSKKRMNT